ncbi:unnamed protein product [Pseudo-nitzschia multistriata]|uniref:EGF-like domain-containing protein n=1 Tax=Pseudo-nitzschia multistriata TaxID=183589 RepID=A0A448ZGD9_9STRA|nr:unnamed protein product [Pseudo-nitzschia multistriata]
MKLSFSLLSLALVALSASSVSAAGLSTRKLQEQFEGTDNSQYNAPDAPSYCKKDQQPNSGDKCPSVGLQCAFDNNIQCICGEGGWSCGNPSPTPTLPTPMPTPSPISKPTCNGSDPCVTILKENEEVDTENIAVTDEESSAAGAASAAAVMVAAGAATALVL